MTLFCTECGIELDSHDVDANVATWGVFRQSCTDCVPEVDARLNPPKPPTPVVWHGQIIY